jgi:flagellar protein FlaI
MAKKAKTVKKPEVPKKPEAPKKSPAPKKLTAPEKSRKIERLKEAKKKVAKTKAAKTKVAKARKLRKRREKKDANIIESYFAEASKVKAAVSVERRPEEFVPVYILKVPEIKPGTAALMEQIGERLLVETPVKVSELVDPKSLEELKMKFFERSLNMLRRELEHTPDSILEFLAGSLVNEMLGLGKIEILLADTNLEDVVVNNAEEAVWVYHKKHGWLKTNVMVPGESHIRNYASVIGRKVGRQITTLNPLMDAHLVSGDRVNATLFPISTKGNTISIRKFRRDPWVITDLIKNNTVSLDISALLWTTIQYEMNVIISGGTGSGKTTFLNVLMPFIPINHRIISIEDTREIVLPNFLHWVPMTTRDPNPEGKGEVSMLTLLVNSLRMRPDRIIVGEIRRGAQAEVLFESMHTGHSVYATLHADTAEQTYRRLIHPPISVPEPLLDALDLIVVMFRDRRRGIRRVYQVAEILSPTDMPSLFVKKETAFGSVGDGRTGGVRDLYKWNPTNDKIEKSQDSIKLIKKLKAFTGLSDAGIRRDLEEKKRILEWMVKNEIGSVDAVGKVIAEYYQDPKKTLKIIGKKNSRATDLVPKEYLDGTSMLK